MFSRSLLALLALASFTLLPVGAQVGIPGGWRWELAPARQVFASGDGTLELESLESDGEAVDIESSSRLTLRRGGDELWSREVELAVLHAAVANRGWCTVVGVGRGEFGSKKPRLVTLVLDARGKTVTVDARTLVLGNSPDSPYYPICGGLVVLEATDAMLQRVNRYDSRGPREEWRIHDARGAHRGTISMPAAHDRSASFDWIQNVCAVRRGRFVVASSFGAEWSHGRGVYGHGVQVYDLRNLEDLGRPIWTREFPAGDTELAIAPAAIGESVGAGLTFRKGDEVERFLFLAVDAEGTVTLREPGDDGAASDSDD